MRSRQDGSKIEADRKAQGDSKQLFGPVQARELVQKARIGRHITQVNTHKVTLSTTKSLLPQ